MKCVTFNVNGLRAILKKDFIKDFQALNADIFVLLETKLSDENFPFYIEGYHVYFTNSKIKKGYSGVAILTKKEPLSIHYGLKDHRYDIEGRVITLEYPMFYFVAAYVPNSGEALKRINFRLEFEDEMRSYLNALNLKKPVIYTGDLNVAHQEIDLKNPQANHLNPGFTNEEREKFSILLENGFLDTFRYLHPEKIKYSWWSYRYKSRERNIGWRIDYYLVSDCLKEKIRCAEIINEIYGSDHCPILLEINI